MESLDLYVTDNGSNKKPATTWEKAAATRWGAYISDIEERAILQAHALTKKPTVGLEVGCEGGRWSKMLTDMQWSMLCTDVNEKTLQICKDRIPSACCVLVDPDDEGLSCRSESVDLLLCVEVPPVIRADWFVNEAHRVLRKDGIVVGVIWNLFSFRGFFAHLRASWRGKVDYYTIAYPFWKKKLSAQGFEILHEEGYCWFLFNRFSNSVFVPYFTRLEKELGLRKRVNQSPWVVFVAQKKR